MIQPDTYRTIAAPSTGLYKEKGSKFLAYAFPVMTDNEVKQHVQDLKKEYFDARHHCFAYRIGLTGEQWRANDDGEPSSTGGKPILGQLLSRELINTLVVVVRYFGGIQLGVPGLINAYRSATADALDNATVVEQIAKDELTFSFHYNDMNAVMKLIKDEQLDIIAQQFDNDCILQLAVPKSKKENIQKKLINIGASQSLNF